MKAIVNKIIHHSVVDGPGNRAAVFLQGCNYTCKYCHNPETITVCRNCGKCVKLCPAEALTMQDGRVVWDEAKCCQCDTCIHNCEFLSSPRVRNLSPEEVMDEIRDDIPFIRGITVSGGECSLWRDFLVELFTLAKAQGLGTLMDSNGSFAYMADAPLMDVCDGVMLDVKAFDNEAHRMLTGRSSEPVIANAVQLAQAGKLEEIRTVIVPDLLPNEETVDHITALLAPYQKQRPIRYKIIAYRNFGVRPPYREQLVSPDQAYLEKLQKIARMNGFTDIVLI